MSTVLSILVLASLVLAAGAFYLWSRGGSAKQVFLMLLLAAIMLANVAIWSVPDTSGEAPIDQIE